MELSDNLYALNSKGERYLCKREKCQNYVPLGRKKYCCEECSREANKKVAIKRAEEERKAGIEYRLIKLNIKPRTCLKCNKIFMSNGPYNRICPDCNEKNSFLSHKYYW